MNRQSIWLAERRERLVAQAAAQRIALAASLAPWGAPLALVDRGVAAFRHVRRHPALWLGAMLVMVAWRHKHAGRWARRAWIAWQLGRGWSKKWIK